MRHTTVQPFSAPFPELRPPRFGDLATVEHCRERLVVAVPNPKARGGRPTPRTQLATFRYVRAFRSPRRRPIATLGPGSPFLSVVATRGLGLTPARTRRLVRVDLADAGWQPVAAVVATAKPGWPASRYSRSPGRLVHGGPGIALPTFAERWSGLCFSRCTGLRGLAKFRSC